MIEVMKCPPAWALDSPDINSRLRNPMAMTGSSTARLESLT